MENVLIFGGTGFIGSNLAEAFINSSYNVIVFDKEKNNYKDSQLIWEKIKFIQGDAKDFAEVEKIFETNNIDIVIHLIDTNIARTSHETFIKNLEMNLVFNLKLVDIIVKHNIKKFVYFSSGGSVYGNNGSVFNNEKDDVNPIIYSGWVKISIEKYIQTSHFISGLNYLIVRPSNPYGKYQNYMRKQGVITAIFNNIMSNKNVEIWGDGSIVRDYIYIDDLCDAIIKLIKKDKWNEIYNIGSGVGTSINGILDLIRNVTKEKINVVYLPSEKVDIPVNILDISKIKSRTDWEIRTLLKEGLEKYWEWFKNK